MPRFHSPLPCDPQSISSEARFKVQTGQCLNPRPLDGPARTLTSEPSPREESSCRLHSNAPQHRVCTVPPGHRQTEALPFSTLSAASLSSPCHCCHESPGPASLHILSQELMCLSKQYLMLPFKAAVFSRMQKVASQEA